MNAPCVDPVLDLARQLVATAGARHMMLDLSPYQAVGACVLAVHQDQDGRLPGIPKAALRIRHVRRHAAPASAAATEQEPRYPMLALGPWILGLSGAQGYDQILARHNEDNPGDPFCWTDTVYDHDGINVLMGLGHRQSAFFQLVGELRAHVHQWWMDRSTPPAPPRANPSPRL